MAAKLAPVAAALALFCLSLSWYSVNAGPFLHCTGCANITCPAEPTGCVLDRVPCGCCNVCVVGLNGECGGFTSSCGVGLVCVTPGGVFDTRPPWYSIIKGVCTWGVNPNYPTPPMIKPATTPTSG